MFHRADHPPEEARVLTLIEAAALGYHISPHGSHLILRCPYSSPLSFFVKVLRGNVVYWWIYPASFSYFVDAVCGCFCFSQERGVDLEIVRATILYRLPSNFLAVDATVACALS